MADQPRVILFDGECNLCNGAVDFVLRRDRRRRFRFAALQSDAAVRLLAGRTPAGDTLHLVDAQGSHDRSSAVLRIARGLGWPWALLWGLVIIPRPVRDAVYRLIARRRFTWFGRRTSCRIPADHERDRFLT